MSSSDKYCPYCGAPQEEGTKFCGSCGASLGGDLVGSTDSAKTSQLDAYAQPATQQPQAYGSTPTYQQAAPMPKNNATTALILGLIPLVCNCFIFPIIGLTYVKKAEQFNEDPQMIRIARIVNWIFLFVSIFLTIGLAVYYGFFFAYW